MPKLDPADVDQPTLADVQAAAQDNTPKATVPPVTASPVATPTPGFGSMPLGGNSMSAMPGGFGATQPGGFGGMGGGFGGNSFQSPQNFAGQQGQYQQTDTRAFTEAISASAGQEPEHWMKAYWRPAMGWLYMLTCLCDFVVFPVLWSMMQAYIHGAVQQQWNPITLQGAGLYHLAMGAILGIAAYGRTKEKMGDKQ
jgi:Holin of 3TMs, for gene-transfer release